MNKRLLISSLIGMVILAGLYIFMREPLDRFNPWIQEQYVFVKVQGEPEDDDGRYKYREHGVTENGETKQVVFSTSSKLEQGTLVKVLAKGTYTADYTFIKVHEMPSK
ncbi:YxeA family protein [Paenibacillus sp. RRE4]|uniref:YxeA family protein n=1 Tax=Paenibacillus sp. RRE4 TaxID=2962587 RepID=UPI002881D230|nr:YxeA family protein [Paenibacillus sp. RRE4]MDT0121992.1 YxeA family protein [Paenibacillus sp. RRE4]